MTSSPPPSRDPQLLEAFALELVQTLRAAGAPAHRLEATMEAFAAQTGLPATFYVLPTAILASASSGLQLLRTPSGAPSLDRLHHADTLATAVARGLLSPADGMAALRAARPTYNAIQRALATAGASAATALLVGGGPGEAIVAALAGPLVTAVTAQLGESERTARLADVVASALAAFLVHALGASMLLEGRATLIGALVVLLPGFTLTTSMTELATRHYISGGAGMLSAGTTLLQLGVGVALGDRGAAALVGATLAGAQLPPPAGSLLPALLVLPVAFTVLLGARKAHGPFVALACWTAWVGASAGTLAVGPALGGALGATLVTVIANLAARAWDQPAAIVQVPGTLFLVPGTIGFRAVQALLVDDLDQGIQAAFSTLLAAAALVAGTLLGAALVEPRRSL